MAQVQQFKTEEETSAPYNSERSSRAEDTRSAVSKADTMTEEERRAMNRPGRVAFGDPLLSEIPASARHVRPEELMEALSAIEARKGEALVGTHPLGMALLQTNTGVPAETVWEEIQKQREQQVKASTNRKQGVRKRTPVWAKIGLGAVCIGATFTAVRVLMGDIRVVQESATGPQPSLEAATNQITKIPRKLPNLSPDVLYVEGPGMIPLTSLPSGKAFYMDPHKAKVLNTVLNGDEYTLPVPPDQLKNYYLPFGGGNNRYSGDLWNTIFMDGKFYIRGWIDIPPGTKKGDLLKTTLKIANRPDNPDFSARFPRQITIPTDEMSSIGTSSTNGFATLTTSVKHLDNAAWGEWEPLPPPPDPYGGGGSYQRPMEGDVYLPSGKSIKLPIRNQPYFSPRRVIRVPGGNAGRTTHFQLSDATGPLISTETHR